VRQRLDAERFDAGRDLQRILARAGAAAVDVDEVESLRSRAAATTSRLTASNGPRCGSICSERTNWPACNRRVNSDGAATGWPGDSSSTRSARSRTRKRGRSVAGAAGAGSRRASTMAAICCGVVPQQPPIKRAPRSRASRAKLA
jgi:hypothetical protein